MWISAVPGENSLPLYLAGVSVLLAIAHFFLTFPFLSLAFLFFLLPFFPCFSSQNKKLPFLASSPFNFCPPSSKDPSCCLPLTQIRTAQARKPRTLFAPPLRGIRPSQPITPSGFITITNLWVHFNLDSRDNWNNKLQNWNSLTQLALYCAAWIMITDSSLSTIKVIVPYLVLWKVVHIHDFMYQKVWITFRQVETIFPSYTNTSHVPLILIRIVSNPV